MDTEILVDTTIEDGQRLLDQLARDDLDVTVAFWAKRGEDYPWELYLAVPGLNAARSSGLYGPVYGAVDKIGESGLSISDIRLIDADDPIALDAIKARDRHPSRSPTKFRGKRLGTLRVTEALIHPALVTLRQSFSFSYTRRGEPNVWRSTCRRGELLRDVKSKGAVAYSSGHWEGEKEGEENHASVFVLLEIDPRLDDADFRDEPRILREFTEQARVLADEMFMARHPGAVIERPDETP